MGKVRDIAIITAMAFLIGISGFFCFQYLKVKRELNSIKQEVTAALKSTAELDSLRIEISRLTQELNVSSDLRKSYEKKLREFREKHKDIFKPVDLKKIKQDTSKLLDNLEGHRDYIFQTDSLNEKKN